MGRFIKKGNDGFRAVRNGEFVDKSRLIEIVNATLNTERQFTCVSRARRFGKSVGAKMLYSYYDQWCGERELFSDLQVNFEENAYYVHQKTFANGYTFMKLKFIEDKLVYSIDWKDLVAVLESPVLSGPCQEKV